MQSNVTVNGYHLPTLARLCKELDSPAQGALAEFIWRLQNRPSWSSGCSGRWRQGLTDQLRAAAIL